VHVVLKAMTDGWEYHLNIRKPKATRRTAPRKIKNIQTPGHIPADDPSMSGFHEARNRR
jgi:hypothetical protein